RACSWRCTTESERVARFAQEAFRRALWLPALVLAIHLVGSRVFDVYTLWPPFDIPMHLMGGFAIAFAATRILGMLEREKRILPRSRAIETVLVFGLVTIAAVCWEFAEWIGDHLLGTHAQIDLDDTLSDMAFGMVGGAVFLAIRAIAMRRMRA